MHFIILFKFKDKPTQSIVKKIEDLPEMGIPGFKPYGFFWTLGSFDAAWHIEADTVAAAFSVAFYFKDLADVEVMLALSLEEGAKLL